MKKAKPDLRVVPDAASKIQKFLAGDLTAQETHRAAAFHAHPCLCGRPAVVRIKVLVQLDELIKRQPEMVAQICASNSDGSWTVPTIPTKYGQMVKVSDIGACEVCRADAEKAAARGPSWAVVEIDRGPNPNEAVSATVPDQIKPRGDA